MLVLKINLLFLDLKYVVIILIVNLIIKILF